MIKALCEYTEAELRQELEGRAGDARQFHAVTHGGPLPAGWQPQTPYAAGATIAVMPPAPLRLDLGCGKNKQAGFVGVDSRQFDGVDVVTDLGAHAWPWPDASVEEVHCSHMLEHLTASQRVHFANELFRVLKPGGKATIITPHWNSPRAYGDLTHQWPPVSEWWFLYLSKAWREVNAPHGDGYTCDFPMPTIGYSPNPGLCGGRNPEFVQEAVTKWRGGADDMAATLVKPK